MRIFVVVLLLCASATSGSRILLSAPSGSKSHQNMYIPLISELAKRGHHVTFITNYESSELKKYSNNVRQFVFPELAIDMNKMPNSFKFLISEELFNFGAVTFVFNMFWVMTKETIMTVYSHPDIKEMMSTEKFDLVMISAFNPAGLPFAWHYKAPMIQISPMTLLTGMATTLGDDENYCHVPFLMTSFSDKMSLKERTINFVISKFFEFGTAFLRSRLLQIMRDNFFPKIPPFNEIEKETSLIFTNAHPTFAYPRTLAPQVIEIGGPHCRPPKPLETELETFVNGSEAGFVVFGVGSYQRMDDMPEKLIQPFIKAFSRIPQRVVWQWKGKPRADFPKNVLAMPWLPQQDLLGHKKCRLFMTHGGLNGLQEAIYHAVPILGLPLGADQNLNIMRAARDGYGLKLDWKDVTEEALNEALQSLLHNSSFTKSVKKLSGLYRDQIQSPLDRAVYWTEFVLRHNGTDHLKLASKDLTPLQRSLVDVYLILFLISMMPLLVTIFCVRMCCCRRRAAPIKSKTAQKSKSSGKASKAETKKSQ